MLAVGRMSSDAVKRGDGHVSVAIGSSHFDIAFAGSASVYALEQLATAIESRIAYSRAVKMAGAAKVTTRPPPLWLVSGPTILGQWLAWSHTQASLRGALVLTDEPGSAPISGVLARRARRELGQPAAKVRVRAGMAVAERIELSHRVPAVMSLGERAHLRIRRHALPETIVDGLKDDPARNDRRRLAELVDHPFFATLDVCVERVRNDGTDAIIEVETRWAPLEPVPGDATRAIPRDADPVFPWRATARETAELYRLVDIARRQIVGAN